MALRTTPWLGAAQLKRWDDSGNLPQIVPLAPLRTPLGGKELHVMAGGKTFKRDQKRRKEMARKMKQEEKLRKKVERRNEKREPGEEDTPDLIPLDPNVPI
ncbi:MAG TPA: hypothetical protein VEB21_03075 [Terriglobales bacterium]|nr:hypothetical protein [Terriglobales bacterium]